MGIITLFNNNLNSGAILQAYALEEAVKKLGCYCDVINYKRKSIDLLNKPMGVSERIIHKLTSLRSKGDLINLVTVPFQKYIANKYKPLLSDRSLNFEEFIKKYMTISRLYDSSNIQFSNSDYDCFICGSDQIWRPSSFDANYYLNFVTSGKIKFSYAASLGVSGLSEKEKEYMRPLIEELDGISVREESSVPTIAEMSSKEVISVLDPTLLFDSSFWTNLVKTDDSFGCREYAFSYMIGDNNSNRDIARHIAKIYELKLVAMPAVSRILPYDLMYADENIIDAAPDDFLTLIYNSKVVITDSFHACVFSILFGKPFYVVERFTNNVRGSMNSRIYDLLSLFNLNDRLINTYECIEDEIGELNISCKRWKQKQEFSWAYLKKYLDINKPDNVSNII